MATRRLSSTSNGDAQERPTSGPRRSTLRRGSSPFGMIAQPEAPVDPSLSMACVAQVHLDLEEGWMRRAAPGGGAAMSRSSSAASNAERRPIVSTIEQESIDFAREGPQVVRIQPEDTAADVIDNALNAYYQHALPACRGRRKAAFDAREKQRIRGLPPSRRLGSAGSQRSRNSSAGSRNIDAEWDDVLPSRYRIDYVLVATNVDGSLPQSEAVDPLSGGALPHSADSPSPTKSVNDGQGSRPGSPQDHKTMLQKRVIGHDEVVRVHALSSFPFVYRICYQPAKRQRWFNVAAASAGVSSPKSTSPASSPTHFGGNVSLQSMQKFLTSSGAVTSQPASQALDDETAISRGLVPLPFLPAITPNDPTAQSTENTASSQKRGEGEDPAVAAGEAAAAKVGVATDDLDLPIDTLMQRTGVTLYDIGRHGSGPLAVHCKGIARSESLRMTREEIEERRQGNIVLHERRRTRREAERLVDCEKKSLSLREEAMLQKKREEEVAEQGHVERARLEDARMRKRVEQRVTLETELAAEREKSLKEIRDAASRQVSVERALLDRLDKRSATRITNTTLDGEVKKAAEEARIAGPMTVELAARRPQLKMEDQQSRQDKSYTKLVDSLDASLGVAQERESMRIAHDARARAEDGSVTEAERMVRNRDGDVMVGKRAARTLRHEEIIRRQVVAATDQSQDTRFSKLLSRPQKIYNNTMVSVHNTTSDDQLPGAEDAEERFQKWRAERSAIATAQVGRDVMMQHRVGRPIPDDPCPSLPQ